MKCAMEMFATITELKREDAIKAELERLKKVTELTDALNKNTSNFLSMVSEKMISNRKTSVSFICTDAMWSNVNTYGFDGTIIDIAKKTYYANHRHNGYLRIHKPSECYCLEMIIEELNKLCYNVKVEKVVSEKYYDHSVKNIYTTCELLQITVSIDPKCLAN